MEENEQKGPGLTLINVFDRCQIVVIHDLTLLSLESCDQLQFGERNRTIIIFTIFSVHETIPSSFFIFNNIVFLSKERKRKRGERERQTDRRIDKESKWERWNSIWWAVTCWIIPRHCGTLVFSPCFPQNSIREREKGREERGKERLLYSCVCRSNERCKL